MSREKTWIDLLPLVGVLISVYFLTDAALHAKAFQALVWLIVLGFGVYLTWSTRRTETAG